MYKRTSIVNKVHVTDVSLNSVFEIGDSWSIKPRSKALAVQREFERFYGDEGDFGSYPIFTMPFPKTIIDESINFTRYNDSSSIHVNNIEITSASASGVLHIGSTKVIDAESRVKHIRQLLGDSNSDESPHTSNLNT